MTSTPGPWEHDGKFTVCMLIDTGEYAGGEYCFRLARMEDARLVAAAPELKDSLAKLVDWLEGAEEFRLVHGVHSDTVEAKKLLARLEATA